MDGIFYKLYRFLCKLIPALGISNINIQYYASLIDYYTVAQIDIEFSNSMVEMLFHRLKHRYLFTIPLTSIEVLSKSVDFFLTE